MPEGLSALSHTCRRALVLLRDRAPTKLICEWCGHLRWVQAGAWENWNGERLVGWLQLQQCTQKNVWLSPVAWQQGVGERDEKWVCAWMCSCYSSQRKLQSSQTVRERGTVRWKNCLLRCHHTRLTASSFHVILTKVESNSGSPMETFDIDIYFSFLYPINENA